MVAVSVFFQTALPILGRLKTALPEEPFLYIPSRKMLTFFRLSILIEGGVFRGVSNLLNQPILLTPFLIPVKQKR
ncbi:hypothetical protein JT26_02335 [Porphyromonas sp. COT-108 OH1349]|nr:hypothetical protein JT26_02335 [Porphyromonas sp. COT-108 OH1349]